MATYFTPIIRGSINSIAEQVTPRMQLAARSIMLELLERSVRSEQKYKGVTLQKGDAAFSWPGLADATLTSVQTCRTLVKGQLKDLGFLSQKLTAPFSVVTILNIEGYISDSEKTNSEVTGNQQATNSTLKDISYKQEEKTTTSNGKKRDPYMDECAELYRCLSTTKPPFPLFGRWKKTYGAEFTIDVLRDLSNRRDEPSPDKMSGYIATVLKNEHEKAQQTAPPDEELDAVQQQALAFAQGLKTPKEIRNDRHTTG